MNSIRQNSEFDNSAPVANNEHLTEAAHPFPDEIAHLSDINTKLKAAMQKANQSVNQRDLEYKDTKRYMVDNRGEIDPHELFQHELALQRIDTSGAFAVRIRNKITRMIDSPYFARIDFQVADSKEAVPYYIGQFAFSHDNELHICDWRSPVASMFYDCEVGTAHYDAPIGQINGELTRKRQFKMKNGVMQYVLESSVNIQDDVLQRELSSTSDEKMKSIISTIQKEQNQIIRNDKARTLIIQGVAGSGKTSIALHRIAYLLYKFKEQLSAQHVTILSPNKVFGDYISNVLPELGEEPIYGISFIDMAEVQLGSMIEFEMDKDPLHTPDERWAERVRFKSTLEYVTLMDDYIQRLPSTVFVPTDYSYGRFTANSAWIQERFNAYSKYPVKQRLMMVADDIHDWFETNNIMKEELPRTRTILKSLTAMLTVRSTLALYKDFYKQMNCTHLLVMPAKKTLEWADVYPFLYLHAAYEGLQESKQIRHLVIDEMQDYTPIQYAVMNQIFTCDKTILGDFGQFINPNHQHTLEDMQQLFAGAEFVQLNKSYRSTYEIIMFAKRIQNVTTLEAMERYGDEPKLIRCVDEEDEFIRVQEAIDLFSTSKHVSLGIILKTNDAAKVLYDKLSQEYHVNLISPDSASFSNGITVTSIQMSKGLEFDEVILPSINSLTYASDYDRSLLYIACTRAMHRLTLLYTGQLTHLINSLT